VSRLIPFQLMAACLVIVWLLLTQSVSPGNIILACMFAVIGVWVMAALELPEVTIRNRGAIARLTILVITDIFRSNIAVARIIVSLAQPLNSGFVRIPLDLRDPYGLATLAVIITSTPGTVWVKFDSHSRILTIHVLDLVDESGWINKIKHRYERLLLEIFE
jgi:multicomponent K+:H+ antiporter subunit E